MANKAKHAFGSSANIDAAIAAGTIDAFDILFLDSDTEPKIGWIDKNGQKIIVESEQNVVLIKGDSLPESGDEGIIYIFNDSAYVWNGTEFVSICKPADLSALETEIANKVTAEEVDAKIDEATVGIEKAKYEISHKPEGALVDYREKEIRVMCPANTVWTKQQSGAGADPNSYYIGLKAYAPSNNVESFKEDTHETITDDTMYYFADNDFAGIDGNGRKYSIVWLPVAQYDEATSTWSYHGARSSTEKYVGWYYSVEWYDTAGSIVATDCIRVNLTNEECHSSVTPFHATKIMENVKVLIEESATVDVIEF